MRCGALIFLAFIACFAAAVTPQDQVDAVYGLIKRRLGPAYVSTFGLQIIPASSKGTDVFELADAIKQPYQISIKGSSGVALASGLNWYLKYYCQVSFSWGVNGTGDQLSMPRTLPSIGETVTIESPVKYRYAWNVCTYGYTASWWDWERWEREIDFNALNGINMPLSFVGQEHIWAQVYASLGMTEKEIEEEFTGPAFLAWQRMGNVRGWGGPLLENYRYAQRTLQHRILDRQRSLGMISVLPCFSGHVPHAFTRIYPNANVTWATGWGDFEEPYCCNYLLDPLDPHFAPTAAAFQKALIAEYGTDHWFNCDTFNEVDPGSADLTYLSATSRAVMEGIKAGDPQGKWLMQGWLFVWSPHDFWKDLNRVKAYLDGVSNDDMMILDLYSERSPQYTRLSNYYGKPWVWNMLLNFGGRRAMFGDLNGIATGPVNAMKQSAGSMLGTGITPEAIENNPVMFDLMFEMGWRSEIVNVPTWIANYVTRRYGCTMRTRTGTCPLAQEAWRLLSTSVYASGEMSESSINLRPALDMDSDLNINDTAQVKALRLLMQSAAQEFDGANLPGPLAYDLTDLGTDVLNHHFYDLRNLMKSAYQRYQLDGSRDAMIKTEVTVMGQAMLRLIKDLDSLLLTNGNFLLGPWIAAARAWGTNTVEKDLYEFNARNQITNWGPTPRGLDDYAAKNWQGLVGDYYYSRWNIFVSEITKCVNVWPATADCAASEKGTFPAHYTQDLNNYEMAWSKKKDVYPVQPAGNTLTVLQSLATKYFDGNPSGYMVYQGTDAPYNDLIRSGQTWTRDIALLQSLCDADPNCAGFNTNGYLKSDVSKRVASPAALYVKIKKH